MHDETCWCGVGRDFLRAVMQSSQIYIAFRDLDLPSLGLSEEVKSMIYELKLSKILRKAEFAVLVPANTSLLMQTRDGHTTSSHLLIIYVLPPQLAMPFHLPSS